MLLSVPSPGARASRPARLNQNNLRARPLASAAPVTAATAAASGGADAISFTPSGLLFPYFIGAAEALDEGGYFGPTTRFAGSSGGALISSFVLCGMPYDEMMAGMQAVGEDCRKNGTVWRLAEVVDYTLKRVLPDDAHERCNGRLTIAVSKREGGEGNEMKVDQFYDRNDLVSALVATSAIPYFSVRARGVEFRGQPCASDGGEKSFVPTPIGWDDAADGRPTVVCPFHIARMGFAGLELDQVDVSPDLSEPDVPLKEFLEYALQGLVIQSPDQLDNLRAGGYKDAKIWVEQEAKASGGEGAAAKKLIL